MSVQDETIPDVMSKAATEAIAYFSKVADLLGELHQEERMKVCDAAQRVIAAATEADLAESEQMLRSSSAPLQPPTSASSSTPDAERQPHIDHQSGVVGSSPTFPLPVNPGLDPYGPESYESHLPPGDFWNPDPEVSEATGVIITHPPQRKDYELRRGERNS